MTHVYNNFFLLINIKYLNFFVIFCCYSFPTSARKINTCYRLYRTNFNIWPCDTIQVDGRELDSLVCEKLCKKCARLIKNNQPKQTVTTVTGDSSTIDNSNKSSTIKSKDKNKRL